MISMVDYLFLSATYQLLRPRLQIQQLFAAAKPPQLCHFVLAASQPPSSQPLATLF
jgi:hypothetical protein